MAAAVPGASAGGEKDARLLTEARGEARKPVAWAVLARTTEAEATADDPAPCIPNVSGAASPRPPTAEAGWVQGAAQEGVVHPCLPLLSSPTLPPRSALTLPLLSSPTPPAGPCQARGTETAAARSAWRLACATAAAGSAPREQPWDATAGIPGEISRNAPLAVPLPRGAPASDSLPQRGPERDLIPEGAPERAPIPEGGPVTDSRSGVASADLAPVAPALGENCAVSVATVTVSVYRVGSRVCAV